MYINLCQTTDKNSKSPFRMPKKAQLQTFFDEQILLPDSFLSSLFLWAQKILKWIKFIAA